MKIQLFHAHVLMASKNFLSAFKTAVLRIAALVHIRAEDLAVALVAVLALAEEVRRQVAALGVLHAARCYRGILAFVNV